MKCNVGMFLRQSRRVGASIEYPPNIYDCVRACEQIERRDVSRPNNDCAEPSRVGLIHANIDRTELESFAVNRRNRERPEKIVAQEADFEVFSRCLGVQARTFHRK